MADSSNSTPNIPMQLTDPLDQVLAALLETMAVLAEDPATHSKVLGVLVADLVRRQGAEDYSRAWHMFEAEVVSRLSEAERIARHDAPAAAPQAMRRVTAPRSVRFGGGRI